MKPNQKKVVCQRCKSVFIIWRYRIETARFCSRECADIAKIGIPNESHTKFLAGQKPWNVGKKHRRESIEKMRESHRGKLVGSKNPKWVGDNVSYGSLHDWVSYHKGKPTQCSRCGTTEAKRIEWANIDHRYHRNLNDFIALCTRCHRHFDYSRVYVPKTEKLI